MASRCLRASCILPLESLPRLLGCPLGSQGEGFQALLVSQIHWAVLASADPLASLESALLEDQVSVLVSPHSGSLLE